MFRSPATLTIVLVFLAGFYIVERENMTQAQPFHHVAPLSP